MWQGNCVEDGINYFNLKKYLIFRLSLAFIHFTWLSSEDWLKTQDVGISVWSCVTACFQLVKCEILVTGMIYT